MDSLSSIASRKCGILNKENDRNFIKGKMSEGVVETRKNLPRNPKVLILGAGRVCQPAAELLASVGRMFSGHIFRTWQQVDEEELEDVQVIVASLYLKDAEEVRS